MEWNAASSTWQVILRAFTDDLEMALNHNDSTPISWKLGDEREHPSANDQLSSYVSTHWKLIAPNDQPIAWNFIGKEVDFDLTFIYLESEAVSLDLRCTVFSDGFFDLFDDQVNEVTVSVEGTSHRIWLTTEDPAQPLVPNPHE